MSSRTRMLVLVVAAAAVALVAAGVLVARPSGTAESLPPGMAMPTSAANGDHTFTTDDGGTYDCGPGGQITADLATYSSSFAEYVVDGREIPSRNEGAVYHPNTGSRIPTEPIVWDCGHDRAHRIEIRTDAKFCQLEVRSTSQTQHGKQEPLPRGWSPAEHHDPECAWTVVA